MALAISEIQKLLSIDAPGYRFNGANPQRNSFVPQQAPGALVVSSHSAYKRFDKEINTTPRFVLCDNNLSLIVGTEELLVFDRYGQVQIMRDLHSRGTACLGAEGYAWVTPSGQLSAADINHDLQINRHSLPMFAENCSIPLWMPFEDGFVAAVQDLGTPFTPEFPPRFYLYAISYEKAFWNWIVELEGVVDDIFISSDKTRAVTRQGSKVQVYQLEGGSLVNEFDTEIDNIHAVILNNDDQLVTLADVRADDTVKPKLLALQLDGGRVWEMDLPEEEMTGFLAAGEGGFVVVSNQDKLRTIVAGEENYLLELENPIGHRLTLLKDNQVLAVSGKEVVLYSSDGSVRTLCDLKDYDDNILTAPAVTSDGRVLLGTDRSLIQLA